MTYDQLMSYEPKGFFSGDAKFMRAAYKFVDNGANPDSKRVEVLRAIDRVMGVETSYPEGTTDAEIIAHYRWTLIGDDCLAFEDWKAAGMPTTK